MCGRYSLAVGAVDFIREYGLEKEPGFVAEDRYNIAPTQPVMIVREDRFSGDGRRELAHVLWGLIPPWAEKPSIAYKMINARSETVTEKPAYRNAFKRRRCLLPATGFYEWKGDPEETARGVKKVPHFFQLRDGSPFAFAGLWESWTGPDGELLESCTILTTRANSVVLPVHERMPVIIPPADYDLWLNPEIQDPRELTPLCRPYDPDQMKVFPVRLLVNNPRNEGAELVVPAEE